MSGFRASITRLGLIVLASATGASYFGQARSPTVERPRNPGLSLRCRIQAGLSETAGNVQRASKGKSAILRVSLENLSDEAVEINGIAANLAHGGSSLLVSAPSDADFDALVDIHKKSALELKRDVPGVLAYPKQRLTIAPHQSLTFDLDVAELKWQRMISSSYSPLRFWATVPPGSYREYLSIIGRDGSWDFRSEIERAYP